MKDAILEEMEFVPEIQTPGLHASSTPDPEANAVYETACSLPGGLLFDFGGTPMSPLDEW